MQSRTMTLYEEWFGKKPSIKHSRVFGATAYLNIPKVQRKKFDPASSKPLRFVSYDGESGNYRLWDETKRKVYITSEIDSNEVNAKRHVTEQSSVTEIPQLTGQQAVMPPELLDARPSIEFEQVLTSLSEPQA